MTHRYVYFVVSVPPYGHRAPRQLFRVPLDGGPEELLVDAMAGWEYAVHPDDAYVYAKPYGAERHGRLYRLDTRTWEDPLPETVNWHRMVFEPSGNRAIARAQLLGPGMVSLALSVPAGESRLGHWRMSEDVLSENAVEVRWNVAWRNGQPLGWLLASAGGEPARLRETNMLSGEVRTAHAFEPDEDLGPGYLSVSADGTWAAMWVTICPDGPGQCPWSLDPPPATLVIVELSSGVTAAVNLPEGVLMVTDLRPRISPDGCRVAVPGAGGLWVLPVREGCS